MLVGCKMNTPLSINPSSVTVKVGQTESVAISCDGDASAVTELRSEDPSIAYTHGTIITGRNEGKTRVFVQQLDAKGNVVETAYCSVTVIP